MKELSLNILDIAQNSISAEAKNITINLDEDESGILTIRISDDGHGMSEDVLNSVSNPFYTTRTTRKVGLGIPLIKMAAEQTGGRFEIKSALGQGTELIAVFNTRHIDCIPVGDMTATITTLIMGAPDIDFVFSHKSAGSEVRLSTLDMRLELGNVSLADADVIQWVREYLTEQYINFGGAK